MAACHVVMLREAPASPPIMSQGSYLRVSSFPRGFHPRRAIRRCLSPFRPFCVFYHPLATPAPLPPPHDPTESPFSPRYFTAPRSPLRILYLLVFSGLVFIPNAASRMRNVRPCTCTCTRVNTCTYSPVYIHKRKTNACGPFWRLCERRHACGAHSLSLSFCIYFFSLGYPRLPIVSVKIETSA